FTTRQVIITEQKSSPPTHLVQTLRVYIRPAAELTEDRWALSLGVWMRTVNEIVTEKRSLSADMAHRLARLFNTTPEFWLGLQQDVDLWKASAAGEADYRKIKPLRTKVA